MDKLRFGLALVVASALGACTSSGSDGALNPGPPPGGQQLATPSYHLEPGEEKYMCYQFYSPADAVAVTHVDTITMPGIHHIALYQVLAGNNEPDDAHECPVIFKVSWIPVFVSGTGAKDFSFPSGVGMKISSKTQYVLQLHMQNATEKPMDLRAGVNLTYDKNPDSLQAAGIFALGKMQIDIPPSSTDFSLTETCKSGKTRNVFAVLPHMHKLGTSMDVMLTPSGGAQSSFYNVSPWTFGNQPIEPLVQTLGPDDSLTATCHWNNPGTKDVTYGESSDNEMCFFVMFYYPFDRLDGCID